MKNQLTSLRFYISLNPDTSICKTYPIQLMVRSYIFSSESVVDGHPDKVADTISDAILDACLEQDKRSRVACETFVKSNVVCVGGEITTKAKFDYEKLKNLNKEQYIKKIRV